MWSRRGEEGSNLVRQHYRPGSVKPQMISVRGARLAIVSSQCVALGARLTSNMGIGMFEL